MPDFQTFHYTPLHRWAETQPHLSCERLMGILDAVVRQLRDLHAAGQAHGGITADSLVVNPGTQQVDVPHFLARRSEHLARGSSYSPPEANLDPPRAPSVSADIYSFAAALYHVLQGQEPTSAQVRQLRGVAVSFAPGQLAAHEQDALSRALSLDVRQRPASIAEFETLLSPRPLAHTQPQSSVRHAMMAAPPAPASPPVPKCVIRLPMNLTRGKACQIPISALFPDGGDDWEATFPSLHELGLALDEAKENITGVPIVDGEHRLIVSLGQRAAPAGRPRLERSISVTINPDPAAIWKNLPSDSSDPHWKPDSDHMQMQTPAAFAFAASVRGRSHAQEGLFRDDDFRLSHDDATGWHLLAVADGAGSAKLSRRGSQLACAHAIQYLHQQLREDADQGERTNITRMLSLDNLNQEQARSLAYTWLGGAAHAALKAITEEAESQEPPRVPKEYATTLLLAAARRTQHGWIILSFGIGDGGIGLMNRDGTVQVMSTPDSGEFSSETIFLTSKNLWMTAEGITQRLHAAVVPDFHAMVLMTDGITDPLFPTEASLSDAQVWQAFWQSLIKEVQTTSDNPQLSEQLQKWAGFYSKGNHDDRTLALLMPAPVNEPVA